MKMKLAVPMLVLGLALFGCGSSSSSNTGGSGGSTGGSGGSTGGSGGSTGGSGGSTGGSGGSTGGSGGATGGSGGATGGSGGSTDGGATDGSASDGSAAETGTDTATAADFCTGYVAGSGMLAGKSAADFCKEYETVCTFTGDMRYMNMGDCVTKYNAAVTAGQTCRAGHLCNAKTGDKTMHCPHATGLSVCM